MPRLVEANSAPLRVDNSKQLSGIFAEIGVFNQNERRYPDDVYMPAYEEILPKITNRRLLGELDHPLDYDEVRLSNVSHVITECHIDESGSSKRILGTVELLDTPAGKIAQALVKAGIQLGISSRGVGNTKKVSGGVDVTQLKLITYDLVADPSFKNAVLSEAKRAELSESLDAIESKLPLNESREHNSIRTQIQSIRESLCYDTSFAESNIDRESIQNLEISSLRKIVESKVSIIRDDTLLLKKQKKQLSESNDKIKELQESLKEMHSRYTAIRKNHSNLQESYNSLKEENSLAESAEIKKKNEEILELRKRLAVECRGMSYSKVKNLLEGVFSDSEINERLDSISSARRSSVLVSKDISDSLKESANEKSAGSRLSKMISRV